MILAQVSEHRNPLTSLPLLLRTGGAQARSPRTPVPAQSAGGGRGPGKAAGWPSHTSTTSCLEDCGQLPVQVTLVHLRNEAPKKVFGD